MSEKLKKIINQVVIFQEVIRKKEELRFPLPPKVMYEDYLQ